MIKTLIASLTLILISVPMAAAAGPEIIVAHRGFGSAAQAIFRRVHSPGNVGPIHDEE